MDHVCLSCRILRHGKHSKRCSSPDGQRHLRPDLGTGGPASHDLWRIRQCLGRLLPDPGGNGHHIAFLDKTPFRDVPIIFAGVALTFGCGIGFLDYANILGLMLSMLFGLILCGVCAWGQAFGMKKYPLE